MNFQTLFMILLGCQIKPYALTGGHGESSDGGLYDDQVDTIMSKFKDYKGTIMRDEIKTLLPHIEPRSRLAFIINTDPHDKPGKHWAASNSLEYFDSFGRSIPSDIRRL